MAAVVAADTKKRWPCDTCNCENGVTLFPRWSIPGVIEPTNRCFRKLVTPRSWYFVELYRHYKNGILPFSGGLLEQPYQYVRAMAIIDQWVHQSDGEEE